MTRPVSFLDLPPEIRVMVYELALPDPDVIKVTFWTKSRLKYEHPLRYVRGPRAFVVTCRTVHAETTTTFYRLNSFEFSVAAHVLRFFRIITPVCFDSLRSLSFTFTSSSAWVSVREIYSRLAKQGKLERIQIAGDPSYRDWDLRTAAYRDPSFYNRASAIFVEDIPSVQDPRDIHEAYVLSGISDVTITHRDPHHFYGLAEHEFKLYVEEIQRSLKRPRGSPWTPPPK